MIFLSFKLPFTVKITAVFLIFVLICGGLYALFTFWWNTSDAPYSNVIADSLIPTVVIDAGHGGVDGGAVGINGLLEKDLNLDVALVLNDLFGSSLLPSRLTRSDDRLLCDENTKGSKKTSDLKNRLLIANEVENSIFLSIHMNKFSMEEYSGLQVYYSPNNELSFEFAQTVKNLNKTYLQPDNERPLKEASSNIYLLNRIKIPAILVECGFLSNEREAELLSSEVYRKKLAVLLFASVTEFMEKQ